jgi:subtilisin family serine protease
MSPARANILGGWLAALFSVGSFVFIAPGQSSSPIPRSAIQLPYTHSAGDDSVIPMSREIPGRRVPQLVQFFDLTSPSLPDSAVPLPEANTLAHINFSRSKFGRLQNGRDLLVFNPEFILVKFHGSECVDALRVEPMREWDAVRALRRRADVEFAELDTFEERQFMPNDPQITNQWHHAVIGSFRAWDHGLGSRRVHIAIVDKPFQTDHPDLAPNVVPGWDIVANAPIKPSADNFHSTMCAGIAAAVINNGKGVAGVANCAILPININGAISEMYNATIWAADHGIRVVNISWSGANTDTLEAAGRYLKTKSGGILAMPSLDGSGRLNWTNQPDIYCISMTDAADNLRSRFGPHVDFAAPGFKIFSTAPGGGYAYGTGASYSAPLFAGVVAALFSINPVLGPDDAIAILKRTAFQPGQSPWNEFFGWGRINFAAAAAAASEPIISHGNRSNGQATVSGYLTTGLHYTLWQTTNLTAPQWSRVSNAVAQTNGAFISLTDPQPAANSLYRIEAAAR